MPHDIDLSLLSGKGLDLDQYFGLWAVDDSLFMAQFDRISQMNLLAHVEIHQAEQPPVLARVAKQKVADEQTLAVISIQGMMTKRGSSLSDAGSTIALRSAVRKAARDSDISAILLVIDSGGGTVAGTADFGREVFSARKSKPVFAFIEDMTASAAYWIASQADRVYANAKTALVGSIGTFIGLYDYSAQAVKEGVRPVVIKAGKFKGAGFEGTTITDEQKAYWQGIVDSVQAQFTEAVASGRRLNMTAAENLVQGRVWVAAEAVDLKLIDGIQSYEETVAELISVSEQKRKLIMSEKNTAPVVASFEDLKACLPGADSDFLCSQLEKKATLDQAQSAWMEEQNKRVIKANKAEAAANEAVKAAAGKPGLNVEGEGTGGDTDGEAAFGGDPIAEWDGKLAAKVKAGMSRAQASSQLNREVPGLREAYVAAYNAQHGRGVSG